MSNIKSIEQEQAEPLEAVVISHEEEYPMMKCRACRSRFVLMEVFTVGEGELDLEKLIQFKFCPFCGNDNDLYRTH